MSPTVGEFPRNNEASDTMRKGETVGRILPVLKMPDDYIALVAFPDQNRYVAGTIS